MTTSLPEKLANCEIKLSELSSQILAQESYILSLESEIQSLKFQLSKSNTKDTMNTCTQTSFDILTRESPAQTTPAPANIEKYVQTDLAINKNFLLNDEISTTKKLLMAFEEVNKENSGQDELSEESDLKMDCLENAKGGFVKPLNFISALNLKSDLPAKEACPKSINSRGSRRYSQDSNV